MNRLAAGYCTVVNPFNSRQVSYVSLVPADVDAIAFCTKNAAPMLPHLGKLDDAGFRYYFQYTITGYGQEIEPHVPLLPSSLATFRRLSERIGPERMVWRYDPIIISGLLSCEYHESRFAEIAGELEGCTRRVVISIVDHYRHVAGELRALGSIDYERSKTFGDSRLARIRALARAMVAVSSRYGMQIQACAERFDLRPEGILPGKCIDDELINRAFGLRLQLDKHAGQRQLCGCVSSKDIGVYDSCPHACRYCYANRRAAPSLPVPGHDEISPSLIGWLDAPPPVPAEPKPSQLGLDLGVTSSRR
jgi:hypothetical protein